MSTDHCLFQKLDLAVASLAVQLKLGMLAFPCLLLAQVITIRFQPAAVGSLGWPMWLVRAMYLYNNIAPCSYSSPTISLSSLSLSSLLRFFYLCPVSHRPLLADCDRQAKPRKALGNNSSLVLGRP